MSDKREHNLRYYQRTRDRIILREDELRPSTILEIIDCLRELEPHPPDKRIAQLYRDIIDSEPPTHG